MKHFLIWIFLFFFAMSGFAQDLNIKGQITDTSGESIIGVNVKVKGKDTGTITDIDGNYHLQAAPNDILVVSYIGFITQYLQLIIPQYFISNKSGIWSLSLIVHSKG